MNGEELETETDAIMDLLDERDVSAEEALWITSLLASKAIAQLPLNRPKRKAVIDSFMKSMKKNIRLCQEMDNRQFAGEGRYSQRFDA